MGVSLSRRAGAIMTVELVLVMPIVLGMLYGILQLSQVLMARQTVALAAREGARQAAITGSVKEGQLAARRVLATSGRLVQAEVQVDFLRVKNDREGNQELAVVIVGAPANLTLLWLPSPVTTLFRDQMITGRSVMRVE